MTGRNLLDHFTEIIIVFMNSFHVITIYCRPGVAEAGCAVVGALTLRQSGNAREVVENEGAVAILNAMEKHPSRHRVQSSAAAAIRNIVSRDKDLRQSAV